MTGPNSQSAIVAVVPGRENASGGMMTMGCSGLGCATSLCVAAERGFECSLCVRHGAFPAPGWWRDGSLPMPLLRKPSVQIGAIGSGSLKWAVFVVLQERYIDPRFPIIGTADANQAIDLALYRARQLRPKAKLERLAASEWAALDVPVFCGLAVQHASRWRLANG